MVTSSEDSDSVSSLVWWRVPTTATVRALYALAFSVAQPADMSGMVHPDDVTRKHLLQITDEKKNMLCIV